MKVVVVGASYAGLACAKSLIEQNAGYQVTVVDPKDFLDINFMNPRLLQEPDRKDDTVIPFSSLSWASQAQFIKASVKSLTKSSAELDYGESIGDNDHLVFDFAIIATGPFERRFAPRTYPDPWLQNCQLVQTEPVRQVL